jgi:hypothetical protein
MSKIGRESLRMLKIGFVYAPTFESICTQYILFASVVKNARVDFAESTASVTPAVMFPTMFVYTRSLEDSDLSSVHANRFDPDPKNTRLLVSIFAVPRIGPVFAGMAKIVSPVTGL